MYGFDATKHLKKSVEGVGIRDGKYNLGIEGFCDLSNPGEERSLVGNMLQNFAANDHIASDHFGRNCRDDRLVIGRNVCANYIGEFVCL